MSFFDPEDTPFNDMSAWSGMPPYEDLTPVAKSYLAQFAEGTGKSAEELYEEIMARTGDSPYVWGGDKLPDPCGDCPSCKHNARLDAKTYGENTIHYEAHFLKDAWDDSTEQARDNGLTAYLHMFYDNLATQNN